MFLHYCSFLARFSTSLTWLTMSHLQVLEDDMREQGRGIHVIVLNQATVSILWFTGWFSVIGPNFALTGPSFAISGSCDGQEDLWHLFSSWGRSHDPLPQHGDSWADPHLHHKGRVGLPAEVIPAVIGLVLLTGLVLFFRMRERFILRMLQRTCWRALAARHPWTWAGGTCGPL